MDSGVDVILSAAKNLKTRMSSPHPTVIPAQAGI